MFTNSSGPTTATANLNVTEQSTLGLQTDSCPPGYQTSWTEEVVTMTTDAPLRARDGFGLFKKASVGAGQTVITTTTSRLHCLADGYANVSATPTVPFGSM